MTSVTIPSSTAPLHGAYSSSVREPEISNNEGEFEAARSMKRCLSYPSTPTGSADSCKKRRKQATPIRISTNTEDAGSPAAQNLIAYEEGSERHLECPVCHLQFESPEQVQNHLICDHPQMECKKEPDDLSDTPSSTPYGERSETPLSLTLPKPEVQWMNDLQPAKDWMNPNLAFNPFMAMSQFPQPEAIPMKPIRIFNPDAYCDLCNKEFCNKYFLKTHKANKHGIYSDAPPSDQQANQVSVPSFSGNMKLPSSVPSLELLSKCEPRTPPNLFNPSGGASASSSSDGGEKAATAAGGGDEAAVADDSGSPNIQTESTSIKTEPETSYYDSMKMSPGQSGRELDLSNRLRRIGVMNPKAFCEICCKEYCNKYFLRTHKMKRHGIYIPDEKEGGGGLSWPPSVQTSPLNLIVTEQSNPLDRKTTSPSDISCDACGIRFQNAALAQLHNFSVHGKVNSKEGEHGEIENAKPPPEANKSLNAEAISEDLQKLQTMILQLNDLDVSKLSAACSVCGKEFDNRFFLHAHMVTDHGILLDEAGEGEKPANDGENTSNNNTLCDVCGKDLQSAEEMKKHMFEYHSTQAGAGAGAGAEAPAAKDDFNGFPGGEKPPAGGKSAPPGPPAQERRVSVGVAPTSSYCEICNKELCNKYFMKTHMQRMHGIEIENGAQIGGVVCDICNKELCSKYFLRVHKHNTHGIVEYGASLLQPRKSEGEGPAAAPVPPPPPPPPPPAAPAEPDQPPLKPADLADLSHRYFTHFTEVCPVCSRRFRSTKWLKAHLVGDHGQAGAEKWAELEQQLQQGPAAAKGGFGGGERAAGSPGLKIPNGGGQEFAPPKKVGIQNVLSNLFGVDDVNAKTYQCSYCPFTTPLLPLLFVHERSHSLGGEGLQIKCPACPQAFAQRELFQRHVFAQHPFLPGAAAPEEADAAAAAAAAAAGGADGGAGRRRAAQRRRHDGAQPLAADVGQSLREVARKAQLPTTYALPEEGGAAGPGYVMQAFLLEESAGERRVVPSVVFLPMLQKQPAPLTVTFTLTPA